MKLKLASGRGAGTVMRLDGERTIVGRGPGVDRAGHWKFLLDLLAWRTRAQG